LFSRRVGLEDEGNPIPLDGAARFVRRDEASSLGRSLFGSAATHRTERRP
jgi:hypothetical protein